MYQALYRKWRPKVFSDVIGQSHITETLQDHLRQNSGQGGQLRASGERRSLLPVPFLYRH